MCCVIRVENTPVGKHPVLCRFFRGAFETKPSSNILVIMVFGMCNMTSAACFEDSQSLFLAVLKGTHRETSHVLSVSYNSKKTDFP